jgi:hypothetical protein
LLPEFAQGLLFEPLRLVAAQSHRIGGMTETDRLYRTETQAQNLLFTLSQTLNHLMEPEVIVVGLLQTTITDGIEQRTT